MNKEKRIIVAGSRDFHDYELLKKTLEDYVGYDKKITIISGCANGADILGEKYAKEYGIKCIKIPAIWHIYGKSAGYRRNKQMAMYAIHDAYGVLFAFWNGKSKGTNHMINIAKKYNLEIHIINY